MSRHDAGPTEGPLLSLRHVERWFGASTQIGPIDLEMDAGERVAFVGPNGSGKSTVLRCIVGTLSPTIGEIVVSGHRAGTLPARRLIGVSLSQERSFDLRLSGHDNLLFYARIRYGNARAAERAVRELEEELELGEIVAQRVASCSTGMTQQLAFARALIGSPPLVLLDEPTRSLDHDARERLWAALSRRDRAAAIISSHRDDDVARCDRVYEFAG